MIWILLAAHVLCLGAFFWGVRLLNRRLQAAHRLRMKQVGEALGDVKLLQQQLASADNQHRKDMDARDERITRIVKELSHLRWDRRAGDRYAVTVEFDPRMFGYSDFVREDLFCLAKDIGMQVTHEIASCKFVETARETEREYRYPSARKFTW